MKNFDWLQAFAMEQQEQPEPGVSADARRRMSRSAQRRSGRSSRDRIRRTMTGRCR